MTADRNDTAELARQIAALRAEVARLNNHRFLRIQNSPWRVMTQRFGMGLMVGLGSVVGASFLVSVLVYLLTQIDFVPILGDWAAAVVADIQANHPTTDLPFGQRDKTPDTGPHPP